MGSSKSPSTTTTINQSTPYNAEALNALGSSAASYYGSGGENPYYGATYAGLSPLQEDALGYKEANIRGGGTTGQAGERLLGSFLTSGTTLPSYLQKALGEDTELAKTAGGGYLDVSSNPYIKSALQSAGQQAGEAFSENILPQLRSSGVSSGMYPSSRQGLAEGVAASDIQEQLNNLASQYYMGQYQTERQNQLGAANSLLSGKLSAGQSDVNSLLGAIGASPSFSNYGANELYNIGTEQQTQLQNELNAMQNFYNQYNAVPENNLQGLAQILYGMPAGGTTSSQSTLPAASRGGAAGALGGAATAGGLMAGLGTAGLLPAAMGGPVGLAIALGAGGLLGSL